MEVQGEFVKKQLLVLISFIAFLSYCQQGFSKLIPRTGDSEVPHRGLHVVDPPSDFHVGLKVVDVMHFGAKANGIDDDATAFMQAWEQACKKCPEQTKLLVPEGRYLTSPVNFQGPCLSLQPIIVEVKGTIIASDDMSSYKERSWFLFEKINGLVLTGGGTFDGRGHTVWKSNNSKKKKNCNLPSSIVIQGVDNALIHDICSVDSKFFHFHVSDSNNFTAYNLRITAPCDSPNTDGMHLSSTNGVQVFNSVIGTGDDCISIGHGVTNAHIFGIYCGPGHGISIGSLGKREHEIDVNGVTVSNCTLTKTTNGVRIKTYASPIQIQATCITFEDIIMNEVQNPIIIDQHYGCGKKKTGASHVKISNVHYNNIRGTTTCNLGINLACSSAEPCQGIEFHDVSLDFIDTKPKPNKLNDCFTASCENAHTIFSGTNKIPICE